nr:translesion error-prone DNA polymerase V autoproteolytic subunit [Acinetobacter sp. Marseille-Q1620]
MLQIQDLKIMDKSGTPVNMHGGKRNNAGRKAKYAEKTVVMRIPESKVIEIKQYLKPKSASDLEAFPDLKPIQIKTQLKISAPLESVAAGFPSPAMDYSVDAIDLNDFLVKEPQATFMLRVNSLSMKNAGIEVGDRILIDRSLKAEHGDIVLALINNEFTVKRLMREKLSNGTYKIWLKAENPDFPHIFLHSEEQLFIWGVVTCILKKLK